MVLPFQAAFVSGFPLVLLRHLVAVLELVDCFTLGVEELVGDRTRSRTVSCRSRL